MPLGLIPHARRLGISNATVPNASRFATIVLRLAVDTADIPIYQQQIAHSKALRNGPELASAEWCNNNCDVDSEAGNVYTMRQVSPHDTVFGRRNLTSTYCFAFFWHCNNVSNQIYYVCNEPEAGAYLYARGRATCPTASDGKDCWNPHDRLVDGHVAAVFSNPEAQFWEAAVRTPFDNWCDTGGDIKRIQAAALAYTYLRLKREAESLGRGHIVLPPSVAGPNVGTVGQYWAEFFKYVHSGVSFGAYSEVGIAPAALKTLHLHVYSPVPDPNGIATTPLASVKHTALSIIDGVQEYRNLPGVEAYRDSRTPLPLNIMISEMGPDLETKRGSPKIFAGGWNNFREGLAWWNTLLAWITRRAPLDCNLKGWDSGEHTVYACVHEASTAPFIERSTNTTRNQWYFDADSWNTRWFVCPAFDRGGNNGLAENAAGGLTYKTTFTTSSIEWQADSSQLGHHTYWYPTPFGVCLAVWSQIGAESWVTNTTNGLVRTATFTLPRGYSTVYFAVQKLYGDSSRVNLSARWKRADGVLHTQGSMWLGDLEEWNEITHNGVVRRFFPAMIYPVVCHSIGTRSVTVEILRGEFPASNAMIAVARPIVLPGICSWFITQ